MHWPHLAALPIIVVGFGACLAGAILGQEGAARVVPPPRDPSLLGTGVERTMGLLAASTPSHRNRVRILFYGQSITEQNWWTLVADDLRKRFPHADLEIENRAIGGFASQMLTMPAEHDLYPYFPDLVIFHVYGSDSDYEQIIRSIRTRTTAEVLMQRDHVTKWPPDKPDEQADKGMWWDHRMNEVVLPRIAAQYGCGLADVRGGWLDYLHANSLEPRALLKDDVHLNDEGCRLMAELIKRHLVLRRRSVGPSPPVVRDLVVGGDVKWSGGRLVASFEGVRADLVSSWSGTGRAPSVRVLVDGRKPSSHPDAYCFTRPLPGPWSPLFIARVDHVQPLVAEDWTLTVTSVTDDGKRWTFDVAGSVTGPDGSGSNDSTFLSKSGRVRIEPRAHFTCYGGSKPTVGYQCRWQARLMGADAIALPASTDTTREACSTLIQGIANRAHRLEIITSDGKPAPIAKLRIYTPPVK